jgi:hypothetical protein
MIQLLGETFPSGASVRNEDGMLPLHLVLVAFASNTAATIGTNIQPIEVVQTILKFFPGAIGIPDNEGNLPIHTAATFLKGSQGSGTCIVSNFIQFVFCYMLSNYFPF